MTHTAEPMDDNRRQLLVATSVVGGAGAVALAAPFVASFALPSVPKRRERRLRSIFRKCPRAR